MNIAQALSVAALSSCLAISSPFGVRTASHGSLLPAPDRDILIEANEEVEMSLWEMLSAVGSASGVHIVATESTRALLESNAAGFDRNFLIPAGDAWRIAQQVLIQNELSMARLNDGEATVVSVLSPDQARGVAAVYTALSAETLGEAEMNPGLHVEVVLRLQNSDARVFSNQARSLAHERWSLSMMSLSADTILVRGIGSEVSLICRRLLALDAAVQAEIEELQTGAGASSGA